MLQYSARAMHRDLASFIDKHPVLCYWHISMYHKPLQANRPQHLHNYSPELKKNTFSSWSQTLSGRVRFILQIIIATWWIFLRKFYRRKYWPSCSPLAVRLLKVSRKGMGPSKLREVTTWVKHPWQVAPTKGDGEKALLKCSRSL